MLLVLVSTANPFQVVKASKLQRKCKQLWAWQTLQTKRSEGFAKKMFVFFIRCYFTGILSKLLYLYILLFWWLDTSDTTCRPKALEEKSQESVYETTFFCKSNVVKHTYKHLLKLKVTLLWASWYFAIFNKCLRWITIKQESVTKVWANIWLLATPCCIIWSDPFYLHSRQRRLFTISMLIVNS